MKIRLDEIPKAGFFAEFSDDGEILAAARAAITLPPGVDIEPKLSGWFRIVPRRGEFFFEAAVEAVMRLQCARCLVVFPNPAQVEVSLVLRKRPDADQAMDAEFVDSEAEAFLIEDDIVDPGEIILQELLLNVPMMPLCGEQCPGLCPTCGRLKGSPECTCPAEERVDARWAALRRLRDKVTP